MSRAWIRCFRYRLLAVAIFIVLVSVFCIDKLTFADEISPEISKTIQITVNWPNKTAIQVEEKITKPWEQILKSISGYKSIESISEVGSSLIRLELREGIEIQNVIQSIRNEYLLQRHRFPEDSLFPRIKLGRLENQYILILQNIRNDPTKNRKGLEQKIRNISGLESLVHYSHKEREILVQIYSDWIQTQEFPSLSQIFTTIRNFQWGFQLDESLGIWFPKDYPPNKESFSKLGLPSRLGEGIKFSSLGKVAFEERAVRHGTRINGASSETMILNAESATSLYHLTNELKPILAEYNDWILLYSSHQELVNEFIRFIIILISVDLVLIIFSSYLNLERFHLAVYFFSYYTSLLLFLSVCSIFAYPLGKMNFFLFIVWKYFFAFVSSKRISFWNKKVSYSLFIFFLFVYLDWIPKVFGLILLANFYFYISISFLNGLFGHFVRIPFPQFKFRLFDTSFYFLRKVLDQSKQSKSLFKVLGIFVFFAMGILFSFFSSISLYSLTIPNGSIQMARLEFPTSIPEQETLRITKQVEDVILERNVTDLLVVKQSATNADFYFRLNELGVSNGMRNLPSESGYFHVLGESIVNSGHILRFSNAETSILERNILPLVPWIRNFPGVTEVILCFQPSVDGLELQSNAKFGSFLNFGKEELVRERSLNLQSAIVGRMLIDKKLTDIRFLVKQNKEVENYSGKGVKLSNGITLFDKSVSHYKEIKTPGRIYHKNGDTSLELLVKGENIHWNELESKINKLLSEGPVRLSEISPQKKSEMKYRPIFLFISIFIYSFRKKSKLHSWMILILFLFLFRIQISIFGDEYLLFGATSITLVIFEIWSRDYINYLKHCIPLIFLVLIAYLFPGEGGKFLFEGLLLVSLFILMKFKLFSILDLFKTKTTF